MTKHIAVLLGGISPERPVSLASGAACVEALRGAGYAVTEIDPQDETWIAQLMERKPDVVLNMLHGAWGEDGRVQGVLDYLRLPYSHSNVAASALAMDKDKTKAVLSTVGVDTPKGRVMPLEEAARGLVMKPPYVIKPNAQGSSVGVFIVREGDNRPPQALTDPKWDLGEHVLVEEFIPGRELTTVVLGDRALAVTEILTNAEFYDYDAKYAAGGSSHVVPAEVSDELTRRCLDVALKTHQTIGCQGLSRTDFRYDPRTDRLVVLEINTQPGMTPTSLAPEQAAYCDISFTDLVLWMAEDASCPR